MTPSEHLQAAKEAVIVSPFEFAIMQAVHEISPDKVTADDLAKVRPESLDKKKQRLESEFTDFFSRIKSK